MLVLSAAEMQACDRATSEQYGIASVDLMRHAAASIAALARQHFPTTRRVTALCGRGNNGGDGLMTARLLGEAGLSVTVLLLGSPDGMKGDAAQAWAELKDAPNCKAHIIAAASDFADHNPAPRHRSDSRCDRGHRLQGAAQRSGLVRPRVAPIALTPVAANPRR